VGFQDIVGARGVEFKSQCGIAAREGVQKLTADFALDADGGVLLFEANAIMNMIPPGPSPQWDYRRPAIARAMAAAQAMFVAKCAPR